MPYATCYKRTGGTGLSLVAVYASVGMVSFLDHLRGLPAVEHERAMIRSAVALCDRNDLGGSCEAADSVHERRGKLSKPQVGRQGVEP